VFHITELIKLKNLPPTTMNLKLADFSVCNKNYHQRSQTDHQKCVLLHYWDHIVRTRQMNCQTLAMVTKDHGRHEEF